jgi:hypothetical protein
MRRTLAPLLFVLALPWAAFGQTIKLPDSIQRDRFIDVSLDGGDFDAAVWDISPDDSAEVREVGDGRSAIVVGEPGTYTLKVLLFKDKKVTKVRAKLFIPGSPVPPPNPVPPGPDPVPPGPRE